MMVSFRDSASSDTKARGSVKSGGDRLCRWSRLLVGH
jgi:hypothetical protein